MNFRRVATLLPVLALGLAISGCGKKNPPYFKTLWKQSTPYIDPNNPVAIDVNGDGATDIVISDSTGRLSALEGATGKRLWSVSLKGVSLTGAAVGNFWGDGSLDVAVADNHGFVHLFNGADGNRLQVLSVGSPVTLDPTVVPPDPTRAPDGTRNYHPEAKDRLVVLDDGGKIHCLEFDPNPDKAVILWGKHLAGHATAPASVGDVDGDSRFDVVVGIAQTREGLLYVLRATDGSDVMGKPERYPTNVVTIPSLADTSGDGRDEIFFYTESGHLHGAHYEPDLQELAPLWEKRPIGQSSIGDPILLHHRFPSRWSVIVESRSMILLRPVGYGVPEERVTQARLTSLLGVAASDRETSPRLIFGDELSNVYDWWVEGLKERGNTKYRKEDLGLTPVIADFDGDGNAESLFCFPAERRIRLVRIPDSPVTPGSIVWQTRGGNLWRTGWRDERYFEALRQRYAYIASLIETSARKAQAAYSAHNWREALAAAARILDINPSDREAKKIRLLAWIHHHLLSIILAGIAALALLGALGYGAFLLAMRTLGLKQVAELREAGKTDEAIALYEKLHKRFPNHPRINTDLADLLIERNRLEAKYAPVFERAYADRPADGRLLRALSECYAREENLSPHAREIYLKSLEVSERPAELRYLIGRSFLSERRLKEAVGFLEEALAGGLRDEKIYQALTDAYLDLHLLDPRVLAVLERVRPSRDSDARFLSYLCEAYLAAGRVDETALACARHTLEIDPQCLSAQILYVRILLDHGQAEGAWRRAEPLLRQHSDRPEVLLAAAHCLVALDRNDDESVAVMEKALEHHPDDATIVVYLAHLYFSRGWFDPHASEIYRRAYRARPDDPQVLEAMATMAEREGDAENAARHLERLIELGHENRETLLALARVYLELDVADERAKRAYETALENDPDNRDYLAALGRVYIALGETSQAAVAVLGHLYEEGADLPGLERCLIDALDRNEDYETLIEVCDKYLETHPDDTEARRIRARAYIATGQADRAIEEYERLLEENPEDSRAMCDLASAYAKAGRSDDHSVSMYKRALKISPELDKVRIALACAYAEKGDIREAIAEFRKALETRGECAVEVAERCKAIVAADPDHTIALRWFLCDVLIESGMFNEAIEHLRRIYNLEPEKQKQILEALDGIIERDPENAYAHRIRGSLLFRSGYLARARKDLEEADRLLPNDKETRDQLRSIYEAILADSEDSEVRFHLGKIYYHNGDLDAALRCFQKSVRDFRFKNESTRQMGKIFMEKNLLDLALEEFQKLPMDDDLKETVYQLGQLYEQRGDGGGARAAYRLIFAADAGFRDVQQRFEALSAETAGDTSSPDRTMILSQLSEKAKHRYKLLEEIGRGAMGIVYKALDSELDEVVALKILPDNLSHNQEALARFRREARSARRLSHRNIVRIHDIGEEMGRKYISMEFVEGTTLKSLVRATGGLEIPRAIKYACQILDALAYAHSIGIVHRDIKPANIIISRNDEVKITDFGIAKILESSDATAEGAIVGTPLYMSPEQVRGEPVDHRADIYAVGILLYECIEGRPPFVKGDLAYSHLHLWPEPMTRGFPELNQIVMRALEKRKEDRWPSAQAMLDALKALKLPEA